jgi:hypothetical protein
LPAHSLIEQDEKDRIHRGYPVIISTDDGFAAFLCNQLGDQIKGFTKRKNK